MQPCGATNFIENECGIDIAADKLYFNGAKEPMNMHKPIVLALTISLLLMACTKARIYTSRTIAAEHSSADNSGKLPVTPTSDSVRAIAYAIKGVYSAVLTGHDDGFDDVHEDQFGMDNAIEWVNIYSLSDFDSSHPALSSLNDCFNVLVTTPNYRLDTISGKYFPGADFNFDQKSNDADTFRSTSYFTLMRNPAILGARTFVIELTKTDSTKFIDTLHIKLY